MSITLRRDPKTVIPDIVDWFEEPFLNLRPFLGQAIRLEDYLEDGRYVVRAEIPGIDADKDLEVSVDSGTLTIRAARESHVESTHRSEFRYGAFSRTVALPPGADSDDVTAEYADGILTVKVAMKGEEAETAKTVKVTSVKK